MPKMYPDFQRTLDVKFIEYLFSLLTKNNSENKLKEFNSHLKFVKEYTKDYSFLNSSALNLDYVNESKLSGEIGGLYSTHAFNNISRNLNLIRLLFNHYDLDSIVYNPSADWFMPSKLVAITMDNICSLRLEKTLLKDILDTDKLHSNLDSLIVDTFCIKDVPVSETLRSSPENDVISFSWYSSLEIEQIKMIKQEFLENAIKILFDHLNHAYTLLEDILKCAHMSEHVNIYTADRELIIRFTVSKHTTVTLFDKDKVELEDGSFHYYRVPLYNPNVN